MKRLILHSDGLWQATTIPTHSNVALLTAAINARAADGTHQISLGDYVRQETKDSILALYRQLAANYESGDQLWFFGFSRGAFIVRSCIGLIRNVGILHKRHLDKVEDAWRVYRTTWGPDTSNATSFRNAYSHQGQQTRIKFLGAWETVGNKGVPDDTNASGFHDHQLSSTVENACQALAIDETNRMLPPCLWRTRPERERTEQCWFSGNHREIGGVGGDLRLANISLQWLANRATALGLALDGDFLHRAMAERCTLHEANAATARKSARNLRPIGITNGDETVHTSAEQRFLRQQNYRPGNLQAFLKRDEQIQLPL